VVGEFRKFNLVLCSLPPATCSFEDRDLEVPEADTHASCSGLQLLEKFGEGGRTKSKWKIKVDQSEHD
jgi:hypothetical protein